MGQIIIAWLAILLYIMAFAITAGGMVFLIDVFLLSKELPASRSVFTRAGVCWRDAEFIDWLLDGV